VLRRPVVDLFFGFVFGDAVAVLDFADELIAFPGGNIPTALSRCP
jgi:hypothetical protein